MTADHIKRVLIVEDHPLAARVLEQVVTRVFTRATIDTSSTFGAAMALLETHPYDFALLDIGLPDGCGIDLVREVSRRRPAAITVVATIFDDDENLFEALRAGASGYLLKGHSEDELVDYLRDAVFGRPPLSPSIARAVLGYFRTAPAKPEAPADTEALTGRETEILQLIAKGCSVKEVSNMLGIANNTSAVHIKSIYRKLNIHNRAEATAAAMAMRLYEH